MNGGDKHVSSLQHRKWNKTHPHPSNLAVRLFLLSDLITSDGRLGGESDATPEIAVPRTNQPPLAGVVAAPSLFGE